MTDAVPTVRIRRATNRDALAVRELVARVLGEYGLSLDGAGVDADLDDIERNYHARGGSFEALLDDADRVVGTVGLYPLDRRRVELRKMYFDASLRGRGVGKALLARTLVRARALGFARVELETASRLVEAMALYERFGFVRQVDGVHAARCDRAYALELAGWVAPLIGVRFVDSD
jgi:putative acetyltransferase